MAGRIDATNSPEPVKQFGRFPDLRGAARAVSSISHFDPEKTNAWHRRIAICDARFVCAVALA
jgi:hypothetical protein